MDTGELATLIGGFVAVLGALGALLLNLAKAREIMAAVRKTQMAPGQNDPVWAAVNRIQTQVTDMASTLSNLENSADRLHGELFVRVMDLTALNKRLQDDVNRLHTIERDERHLDVDIDPEDPRLEDGI